MTVDPEITAQAINCESGRDVGYPPQIRQETMTPLSKLVKLILLNGLLKARCLDDGNQRAPYYGSMANVRVSPLYLYQSLKTFVL
jgi:hypothetical protein